MLRRLVDRLDGFLDRLTGILYGPGPYVGLGWKLAAVGLLAAAILLGWVAGP